MENINADVVVIGGGWSGILSLKCALEEGLSAVLIEKRNDIGGVWLYDDDPNVLTVMKSTQCTSSSTFTELSDYPMPKEIGTFPHHTDILEYMKSYAKDFKLFQHVHLNTKVEKVQKTKMSRQDSSSTGSTDAWVVTCSGNKIFRSRFLVVATGLQVPNKELEKTTLKGFTGPIHHGSEIKHPLTEYKGKRLLLVGGGETASDICLDWHGHLEQIYWSIPRGQHFFRKFAKVTPWGKPMPLDKASSRVVKLVAPYNRGKPGLASICKWTSNGSPLAYQGHGIPEWKNDAQFFKFSINKNGKVLDLVDYKTVVPKGGISKCEGKLVTFEDGTEQEFDFVIMSTGYSTEYPFLPQDYANVKIRQRYKMVFDVHDPTICFIGLVRPIVGAIITISEIQSRWVAKVFSGKVDFASLDERKEEVKKDNAYWEDYFEHTSQRIEGLVEVFTYTDCVLKLAQIYPDYWSLFKKSPRKWMVALISPFNTSTSRLNEEDKLEKSIQTMRRHKNKTHGLFQYYLLILFMRLVWFDWWIDNISEIKYKIQVSPWWLTIRNWRLIKLLNSIWTYPKKFLFNPKEYHNADMLEMSKRARTLMNCQQKCLNY